MSLPYTISAGDRGRAAPVQGNFDDLDGRLSIVEDLMLNTQDNAALYGNGVFYGGLTASQVGTALAYTAGSFIFNSTYYYKTTYNVDFLGYAANTYYVEIDNTSLEPAVYTVKSSGRVNLNTVVWNGVSFDSVTEADRTVHFGFTHLAALPGRDGGQILNGSSLASENLELRSTSHATKGFIKIGSDGSKVGLGVASPTAKVHFAAGSTAAGAAPIKLNSGSLLSTPEAGAFEFLTDAIYFTITSGAARKTIAFLESPVFITPTLGVATATSLTSPTVYGSSVASETLTLESTSDGTKGVVKVETAVVKSKITNVSTGTLALTDVHNTLVCDCSGGNVTLNLPDANTYLGIDYCVFVSSHFSGNLVIVNVNGGDTFDGSSTSAQLTLNSMLHIRAVSANRWVVLSDTGVVYV